MKYLNVIYDAQCALCRRCRQWLQGQPAFTPLIFTPLQALDLEQRFPGINKYNPKRQLILINDEGGIYTGAAAWIMCLYALEDYRELSVRLSHPALMPVARRFCELISHNRLSLSRALHLTAKNKVPAGIQFDDRHRHPCTDECQL